jgi:hypothetical protein
MKSTIENRRMPGLTPHCCRDREDQPQQKSMRVAGLRGLRLLGVLRLLKLLPMPCALQDGLHARIR